MSLVAVKRSLVLGEGSLYAAFPIPAFKLLAENEQHLANRVFTVLIAHLGTSNEAFPSITRIAEMTGMSRGSVQKGLKVLYEYEFVVKRKQKSGRHYRNFYYIQESAYKESKFSGVAQRLQRRLGMCTSCSKIVSLSEVGAWGDTDDYCHFGCGGKIKKFRGVQKPKAG
jgi:hypothetical protein